jgi:GTP pyrophosphokinase
VQLRYIFMDAWAKFSHAFLYKKKKDIPDELNRKVHIMAAACEMLDNVADTYAGAIIEFRENIKGRFKEKSSSFNETPINMESLQAYLEFKFPNKTVKRNIQSLILRDIDSNQYKSISDIDSAIEKAKDFLEWYEPRKPDWFTSGADYVTKALGWIDPEFRKNHPFGTPTREAFRDFEPKQPNS